MAIPIRSIPVLEGETAERFLAEARKVEENPHTIDFSYEMAACEAMIEKAKIKGTLF
ncbi:MAG: hypothetical protein LBG77_05290 [Dysgonamonadaceae bacterium]|jgi:hypothetical protein|nr:hypothetical protein [Dysgonamonadaceae bacterium]